MVLRRQLGWREITESSEVILGYQTKHSETQGKRLFTKVFHVPFILSICQIVDFPPLKFTDFRVDWKLDHHGAAANFRQRFSDHVGCHKQASEDINDSWAEGVLFIISTIAGLWKIRRLVISYREGKRFEEGITCLEVKPASSHRCYQHWRNSWPVELVKPCRWSDIRNGRSIKAYITGGIMLWFRLK